MVHCFGCRGGDVDAFSAMAAMAGVACAAALAKLARAAVCSFVAFADKLAYEALSGRDGDRIRSCKTGGGAAKAGAKNLFRSSPDAADTLRV
jgi:hypothetical protein